MPVRVYTTAPARQLLDDRPFGSVAWAEDADPKIGEAFVITYDHKGAPVQRGVCFPLVARDFEDRIERVMRAHLGALWIQTPAATDLRFEELREEIPVEEFALSQGNKPALATVIRKIRERARCDDLATALARFE